MVQVEQFLRNHLGFGGEMGRAALKVLAAVAVAGFTVLPVPASAESSIPQADSLRVVGHAGPTYAWIRFCRQRPKECHVDLSQPARIALSPDIWATLTKVNKQVNSSIIAVTDQDHWGVLDRWDYPDDGLGDCEDIQLLKRKRLVQAGLPQRALRMAAVIDEEGQGHAVLMVLTDRGDFILDNKRDDILSWRRTGYSFIKREGTNSSAWVELGNQVAPAVTANR